MNIIKDRVKESKSSSIKTMREPVNDVKSYIRYTVNWYTGKDNTITVYASGGFPPDKYDFEYQYPTYQVMVRSSDYGWASDVATLINDFLHKYDNDNIFTVYSAVVNDKIVQGDTDWKDKLLEKATEEQAKSLEAFRVYQIVSASEPLRLGVENDVMEYSLNFDVTLTRMELDS